jgi:hypothetical protein
LPHKGGRKEVKKEKVNIYPTTIEELKTKIYYIMKKNKSKTLHNKLNSWLEWFDSTNYYGEYNDENTICLIDEESNN